ncbi:NADH-dependent FMN reductase [Bifidobacterium aemilianum]|uniref:NADH-dependent FMN reductase n=1 Tax=Bifidobacterium aemilianum TaxID=2493120 RepID=A0A366K7K1_9BIFI|nr:CE1759 family FMN reductase [Bifidobacterium aemilianum]RBP97287.1 NADH-dependent FMN reductase [Bifidobacterium aemilianum]
MMQEHDPNKIQHHSGNQAADRQSETRQYQIAVVSAGLSEPSTTTKLGRAVALEAADYLQSQGAEATVIAIELKDLAQDITTAAVSRQVSPGLRESIGKIADSDGVVVASPVIKASYSGLFKSFWDLTDPDLLLNMPVVLVATGGSERHALVPDSSMRELFAFLRALVAPTSLMAAGSDWASPSLSDRKSRAGKEMAAMILADVRDRIMGAAGAHYRRTFDGLTTRQEQSQAIPGSATSAQDPALNFDSSLMRLAAGGRFGN